MRLMITLLLANTSSCTLADEQKLPPINPAYKSEHGMVLMNEGSRIFAANFPSYNAPNDVQVVYQIETSDVAFLNLVRDGELITMKTQPFNIQHLMRGEEITITANIYMGHYLHDGILVYEDHSIAMSKLLYARQLKDLEPSSQWQQYDMITLSDTNRIYVHKITQAPSFNHLIYVDLTSACLQKFRTSSRVPTISEITYKFTNCGALKSLYFDSESYK